MLDIDELFSLGVSCHRAGRLDDALSYYDKVISLKPDYAEAYNNRGNVLLDMKRYDDAILSYERAFALKPDFPEAYNNRGIALYELKRYDQAVISYERAISLKPDYPEAHNNLGVVLYDLKRYEDALASYDRAIYHRPDYVNAYSNRGNVLRDSMRYEDALESYGRALAIKPDYTKVYISRGNLLRTMRQYGDALASFDHALSLDPNSSDACNDRGITLQDLRRFEEAMESYDRAIALRSDFVQAFNNRGVALQSLNRYHDSLESFDRAIALRSAYPEAHNNRGNALRCLKRYQEALESYDRALSFKRDYPHAHNNRGAVLINLGRFEEALESYDRALAIDSGYAEAHNNKGNVLGDLGRYEEALASYHKAIALVPDYIDANFNSSLIELLLGDFARGWPLFEWRWKTDQLKGSARNFKQPLWLGNSPLSDKTLLLHAEQGLGDTIQFARYVPMTVAMGAKVILEVSSSLVSLLRTLKGDFAVVKKGDVLPAFDLQCPLLSLPLAFKTTLDTVPADIPYLSADPQRRRAWRERLGDKVGPRVGLVWSSTSRHKNDRQRSMALQILGPLLHLGCEFHALQKEVREEDREILSAFTLIRPHMEELHDFADTAALVAEMDVVVSVDTSVAHLAGALGKPVWILLPYAPDYRWLLARNDSPWYPTARLFRQNKIGDWEEAIEEVVSALDMYFFASPSL